MLTGTHDGNLITNQEIVGQPADVVNGQTWIATSFKNYLGETIVPTKIKLKVTTQEHGTTEIEPTTEESQTTTIGQRRTAGIHGRFKIENNELVCEIISSTTQTIESAGVVEITEITTAERTYNEFKFEE